MSDATQQSHPLSSASSSLTLQFLTCLHRYFTSVRSDGLLTADRAAFLPAGFSPRRGLGTILGLTQSTACGGNASLLIRDCLLCLLAHCFMCLLTIPCPTLDNNSWQTLPTQPNAGAVLKPHESLRGVPPVPHKCLPASPWGWEDPVF